MRIASTKNASEIANLQSQIDNLPSMIDIQYNTAGQYVIPSVQFYPRHDTSSPYTANGTYFGDLSFNGNISKIVVQYTLNQSLPAGQQFVVDVQSLLNYFPNCKISSVVCTNNGVSGDNGGNLLNCNFSSNYINILNAETTPATPYKLIITLVGGN